MGKPASKQANRHRFEVNPRENLPFAVDLFRKQFLVEAWAGDGCIVAVTADGIPWEWHSHFYKWPIITIKAGTKPRGAAVPQAQQPAQEAQQT